MLSKQRFNFVVFLQLSLVQHIKDSDQIFTQTLHSKVPYYRFYSIEITELFTVQLIHFGKYGLDITIISYDDDS